MADELKGKRVAFLFTDGAEQVEVTEPLEAVRKAGAETDIVSLEKGEVEMWKHFDKGDKMTAEVAVADADAVRLRRAGAAGRRRQPGPAAPATRTRSSSSARSSSRTSRSA